MTIGTPPQNVKLWVANAAADTWVNAYTGYCAGDPSPCAGSLCTRYNNICRASADNIADSPNTSSTYSYIKSNATFNDNYQIGPTSSNLNVSGDWVSDTMSIGSAQITGLQFGVAYNTTQTRK